MIDLASMVGLMAAALTSLSYIPQLLKAWPLGSTSDLSFKTLAILTAGLTLWIVYGFIQDDWIVVSANGVGATLSLTVLLCKIRDRRDELRRKGKSRSKASASSIGLK